MIHPDARSSCISVIVNTAVRGSDDPKETKVGKGKSFQLEKKGKSHIKPTLMRYFRLVCSYQTYPMYLLKLVDAPCQCVPALSIQNHCFWCLSRPALSLTRHTSDCLSAIYLDKGLLCHYVFLPIIFPFTIYAFHTCMYEIIFGGLTIHSAQLSLMDVVFGSRSTYFKWVV